MSHTYCIHSALLLLAIVPKRNDNGHSVSSPECWTSERVGGASTFTWPLYLLPDWKQTIIVLQLCCCTDAHWLSLLIDPSLKWGPTISVVSRLELQILRLHLGLMVGLYSCRIIWGFYVLNLFLPFALLFLLQRELVWMFVYSTALGPAWYTKMVSYSQQDFTFWAADLFLMAKLMSCVRIYTSRSHFKVSPKKKKCVDVSEQFSDHITPSCPWRYSGVLIRWQPPPTFASRNLASLTLLCSYFLWSSMVVYS